MGLPLVVPDAFDGTFTGSYPRTASTLDGRVLYSQVRFNPNHDKLGKFSSGKGGSGGNGGGVSYDRNIKGYVVAHLPDGTTDTFFVPGSGLDAATVRHPTDMPKPLYHGSNAELRPGDLVEPGHAGNFVARMTHVYLTEDPGGADPAGPKGAAGYGKHVYEVRPTGWYGHRRDARGQNWATSDPVEVIRVVSTSDGRSLYEQVRFNPNHDKLGKFASKKGSGDGYRPGAWSEGEMTREAYVEELAKDLAPAFVDQNPGATATLVNTSAAHLADNLTMRMGDVRVFANGPHRILIERAAAITTSQRERLFKEVDRLQAVAPVRKLKLSVQDAGWFPWQTNGETYSGTGVMRLSNAVFAPGYTISNGMPSASRRRDGMRYLLAHEWGHTQAPINDLQGQRRLDAVWKDNRKSLSSYGNTDSQEGFAEAFAEWTMTGGATANTAAKNYAGAFGWKAGS